MRGFAQASCRKSTDGSLRFMYGEFISQNGALVRQKLKEINLGKFSPESIMAAPLWPAPKEQNVVKTL